MSEIYDDLDELPAAPRKNIPEADRELLELAARAIGARFEEVDGEGYGNLHFADGSVVYAWNSLEFSGDAFELAVQLRLTVYVFECTVGACKGSINAWPSVSESTVGGHNEAARRAVTRAAAEMGKHSS